MAASSSSSLPCSNPSEPVRRRLYELLEQPQEPFLMEVYLLENGCSGRIIRSQSSSPSCWPLNAAGKRLLNFGSHGGIRRSTAAGFLRRALVKLVYSKAFRKVLHLDSKTTTAKKRSSIFDFFSVESNKDQLSPVSVLELQHSDESCSPSDNQTSVLSFSASIKDEHPLPSIMDSPPTESSITLKEALAKSLFHNKAEFSSSSRRSLLLSDCSRETEERIWSFHGCLDPDMLASESSSFREEFKAEEAREIGLCLQAAILDDLKEETILDMLRFKKFHQHNSDLKR